jgi:ketosteroid isomerase-like protein
MRKLLLSILLAMPLSAQILTTEVWVGSLDMRDGKFVVSDLRNISNDPGYDNQPAFFPGNRSMVYTSVIDGDLSDSGLGLHAWLVDLESGSRKPLPEARGFSPTPTVDGKNLMMLREGRVWLHDLETGKLVKPLTETSTAGYYSRFDDQTWVLFMNEPERRIVIYDAKAHEMKTMATGANTAPYRIPGERAVTFVAQDPFPAVEGTESKLVLRKLDLKTEKVTTLTEIAFPTGGQHLWTSRGTLLMASGPQIFEWSPSRPDEWKPVYRADHPELRGISRIAISPRGDRIAIVSTPRHQTIIQESRAASNAALAARNAAGVAAFFASDGRAIAASGTEYAGREAIEKSLAERFETMKDVVYVRTPSTIIVSSSGDAASERGTWTGRWTNEAGPVEMKGEYMAVWRGSIGPTGTPAWSVQSELYVALSCEGTGCEVK